ncbi:DUF1295 domain-containing protein [Bacteroidota bacterium]
MTPELYNFIVKGWIVLGIIMSPVLLKISAPYGRHMRKGWGPLIPNKLGWLNMELPSLIVFSLLLFSGPETKTVITYLFGAFWMIHYLNRSLVYPFRTHTSRKKMPLIIAMLAFIFNLVNGSLNGYYLGFISNGYNVNWIYDMRFILGGSLFFIGMYINIHSDNILLSLRNSESNEYSIPQGGLFKYISCPNFFGEIVEWAGFALMTWNPASLAFFIWTCINLIPRGLDHHRWYKKTFKLYPDKRRAIIPFLI